MLISDSVCSIRDCKRYAKNIPISDRFSMAVNGKNVILILPMDARYCDDHKEVIGSGYDWFPSTLGCKNKRIIWDRIEFLELKEENKKNLKQHKRR